MKKVVFLLALISASFLLLQAFSPPATYHVTLGWNDANCSCNDPTTMYVKVDIYTYPGGDFVCSSDWEQATTNPHTITDNGNINTDCSGNCYEVYAFVKYVDNNGICCEGNDSALCSGEDLYIGFTFPNTITLN